MGRESPSEPASVLSEGSLPSWLTSSSGGLTPTRSTRTLKPRARSLTRVRCAGSSGFRLWGCRRGGGQGRFSERRCEAAPLCSGAGRELLQHGAEAGRSRFGSPVCIDSSPKVGTRPCQRRRQCPQSDRGLDHGRLHRRDQPAGDQVLADDPRCRRDRPGVGNLGPGGAGKDLRCDRSGRRRREPARSGLRRTRGRGLDQVLERGVDLGEFELVAEIEGAAGEDSLPAAKDVAEFAAEFEVEDEARDRHNRRTIDRAADRLR